MRRLTTEFADWRYYTWIITERSEAEQVVSALLNSEIPLFGLDIETGKHPKHYKHLQAGLDPLLSIPRLIQIYDGGENCYVFDMWKLNNDYSIIKPLLLGKLFVAHYAVFELKHLTYWGMDGIDIKCSQIASSLVHKALNASTHVEPEIPGDEVFDNTGDGLSRYKFVGHSLEAIVGRMYKVRIPKVYQTSNWNVADLSVEQLNYASLDAVLTYKILLDLAPLMQELNLEASYWLTCKLQAAVVEMETEGFPIDWDEHKTLCESWQADLDKLGQGIKQWFGSCNLRSPKQKGEWLEWFLSSTPDELKYWPKSASGGYEFNKAVLVKYSHYEPIRLLQEFSVLDKRLNTYGESLRKKAHPLTNRLHTSFQLAFTWTGRLSSREPNLQNLPRVKAVRNIFQAPAGYKFVVADLSQIEMRVAAELSRDQTLLHCFENGIDTHKLVVNAVFGTPIEQVTKDQRQFGKAINFGLMFGMGVNKLVTYAKMSYGVDLTEALAQAGKDAFMQLYQGLKYWSTEQRNICKARSWVDTPLGQRRYLSNSEMYTIPVNHPVQGGAGEVLKLETVLFHQKLRQRGMHTVLCNSVHDELIALAPEHEAEEAKHLLEQSALEAMKEIFPQATMNGLIEAGVGDTWASAKP